MTPATWGIPGPTFLAIYAAAVIGVAILAAVHRRALFGGDASGLGGLGPQQIAYLAGRDKLAIYTALGGLRTAETIGAGSDKTLRQAGPLPAGATPLDTAVYNAAGHRIRARELGRDQWVVAALAQLRDGLERHGLATTAAQRRTARMWVIPSLVLVAFGFARLIDGLNNNRPVGFLIPSITLAVLLAVLAFWKARAVVTRAAVQGLAGLRRDNFYLSPGQSPSYATYGVSGAAMGVALFGAGALYGMDPAFAAEMEVQRASAASGGWSTSSGGGSSCGGGGGSSCGGGGGCGGGGCGG